MPYGAYPKKKKKMKKKKKVNLKRKK